MSQSKATSTTFHIIGGGQRVRQNQDAKIHVVTIQEKETTYRADAGCDGGDSFTGEIWGSLEFVESCAKKWAYKPSKLSFEVVKA